MTTYRVQYSSAALDEIDATVAALAELSAEAAGRWHARVLAAVASLTTFPERCPLAPESEWHPGMRELYVGKRRGTYRVLFVDRGDTVLVARVRHGRQQPLEPEDL